MSAAHPEPREQRPSDTRVGSVGLAAATRQLLPVMAFVVFPVLVLGGVIATIALTETNAVAFWDFHAFWGAGQAVIHGQSPYPPPSSAVLAHEDSFVYPAPAAVAMVPFALIPYKISATLFALLLIACVPVSLRLVGVRDRRCYGIALLSAPMMNAVAVDAVSPVLLLGLALLWRYRDRMWPAACTLAALVVLKLFLWPFLLWFAFTRRLKTGLLALVLIGASSLLSWAVIGFDGLRQYPDTLRILSGLLEGKGYSLIALALSLGASREVAQALPWVVGGVALAMIMLRGRQPGADVWTFVVATGTAFALSPIAWLHYFVLLYVPIAIARPRLSWLWALPLVLWVVRGQSIQPVIWHHTARAKDLADTARIGHWPQIVYCLGVATVVFLLSARARPRRVTT